MGRDEKGGVAEGIAEGGRLGSSTASGGKWVWKGVQAPIGSNAR